MIFYIAIYKCVQRRKYINGFSQWGSMHELFLKDGRGWGTLFVNARFPNRIKPYRFMLNICAVWVFFFVCLFGFLFLATVCRENIISTNFKRHWLMQHANGLTAATFCHISFPLVWFVCLCRVAGTCPSLPAQNYFCISECEKNKEERKNCSRQTAFCSFTSTFLPLSVPLFPAHAYSVWYAPCERESVCLRKEREIATASHGHEMCPN